MLVGSSSESPAGKVITYGQVARWSSTAGIAPDDYKAMAPRWVGGRWLHARQGSLAAGDQFTGKISLPGSSGETGTAQAEGIGFVTKGKIDLKRWVDGIRPNNWLYFLWRNGSCFCFQNPREYNKQYRRIGLAGIHHAAGIKTVSNRDSLVDALCVSMDTSPDKTVSAWNDS
jgi:alkylated DNA nucleotide flippase Atl1